MVGVEPHVLRYWEEELGMEIKRDHQGKRCYGAEDVEILKNVKMWKDKGMQLRAVKEFMPEGMPEVSGRVDIPSMPDLPDLPGESGPLSAPGRPGEPGVPDRPEYPGEPGFPDRPMYPGESGSPDRARYPGEPGFPDRPGYPGEPGFPDRPIMPDLPQIPGEPNEPGLPERTEMPEGPIMPELPGQPNEAALPEKQQISDSIQKFEDLLDAILERALEKNNERVVRKICDEVVQELDRRMFQWQQERQECAAAIQPEKGKMGLKIRKWLERLEL